MRKHPIRFRKEEVKYVSDRWKATESCSLVGVGSVGKTNLLHHLSDPEVHDFYLGEQAKRFTSIIIDPNLLGPLDESDSLQFKCWAGYELMMHRLYLKFYPFDVLGDDASRFYDTYQALQDGQNPLHTYMGLRYFELGLEFFLRRDMKIVFMFDEFEEMLNVMPIKFFQTLRGLRDNYKSNLAYLAFSREPLPVLISKMNIPDLAIEPFIELFTDNVYYVGPYNEHDASKMIDRLMKRNDKQYSEYVSQFLIDVTGRFAGILRATFRAIDTLPDLTPSDAENEAIIGELAMQPAIISECETIWKSLTPIEQKILQGVAGIIPEEVEPETQLGISLLVRKRLLHVEQTRRSLRIEPPLFRRFVTDYTSQP